MQEFDLNNLWEAENQRADAFYDGIAPEVEKLARKQSKSIITKVLQNAWYELLTTGIFGIGTMLLFSTRPAFFWTLLIANIVTIPLAFHFYRKLKNDIEAINQTSLKEALERKISVLKSFIKKLKYYANIGLPLGFLLGLMASSWEKILVDPTTVLPFLGFVFLVTSPILILLVWLTHKRYIPWLYGKHLDDLVATYDHLMEQ